MGTSNGYRTWAKRVLLAAGALGFLCGDGTGWAGGAPYLKVIGPAPLRFISIPDKPVEDFQVTNNDNNTESATCQPDTETSSKDETVSSSKQPDTTEPPIATPDAKLSTSASSTIPTRAASPPPIPSPSITNAAPSYEFVWPDAPPVVLPSPGSGSVTNPISPASEMLFVTPQMLVEFFKPLPGNTNTAPVRVIVPVDIGFQPPLGQPTPSSQAIYRSP